MLWWPVRALINMEGSAFETGRGCFRPTAHRFPGRVASILPPNHLQPFAYTRKISSTIRLYEHDRHTGAEVRKIPFSGKQRAKIQDARYSLREADLARSRFVRTGLTERWKEHGRGGSARSWGRRARSAQ